MLNEFPAQILSLEGFNNSRYRHSIRYGKTADGYEKITSIVHTTIPIVATSMGADPIHFGHISLLMGMVNKYPEYISVVIVNGDWFLTQKKGKSFMPLSERCKIISAIKGIDYVIPFEIENDTTVNKALEIIKPKYFIKGGDRIDKESIPEWDLCKKLGIEIVTGVGIDKYQSSSDYLKDWVNFKGNVK